MSEDTTKQSAHTKSTFLLQLWRVLGRHSDNCKAVFLQWLMLMTPSIAFLAVTWLLATMLLKGRASVSTRVESVINAKIRGGEVAHRCCPFLKKFEATVRCCTQNGIRGGSATVHFPIWHQEIEDIIVLKNNKGTEDNRVRKLDYSIQLSKLFYERFIEDKKKSRFFPLMMFLICMRVLEPIGLMSYIAVTNLIQTSPPNESVLKD